MFILGREYTFLLEGRVGVMYRVKNIQVLETVQQLEDRSDGKNGRLHKRKAAN